jgi:hypothetical protein
MDMTIQDVMALQKMGIDESGWHQPIWWIFAILVAIFLLWWCNKQGDGKADLAAAISNINGRLNTLEPVVKNNAEQNFNTARTLSGIVQGVEDIRDYTYSQIAALDGAVFKSRCSSRCSTGARFLKKSSYTPSTTTVEEIDTCGEC